MESVALHRHEHTVTDSVPLYLWLSRVSSQRERDPGREIRGSLSVHVFREGNIPSCLSGVHRRTWMAWCACACVCVCVCVCVVWTLSSKVCRLLKRPTPLMWHHVLLYTGPPLSPYFIPQSRLLCCRVTETIIKTNEHACVWTAFGQLLPLFRRLRSPHRWTMRQSRTLYSRRQLKWYTRLTVLISGCESTRVSGSMLSPVPHSSQSTLYSQSCPEEGLWLKCISCFDGVGLFAFISWFILLSKTQFLSPRCTHVIFVV